MEDITSKEFIIIALLILVVGILIFMSYSLFKEEGKAFLNPIGYGLEKIEKENNAEIYCTCFLNKPNSQIIYLTKNGVSFETPKEIRLQP